jgi:hypothetical protein
VYLRFQLTRGLLDRTRYLQEIRTLEAQLENSQDPHIKEFLTAWSARGDDF